MPDRCIAGGCNNVANKQKGIKVHHFPSDVTIRGQWVRFVQFKRKDFMTPSKFSVLCSSHFTRECYIEKVNLVSDKGKESGYRTETYRVWIKKDDAVPTVFDPTKTDKTCGPPPPPGNDSMPPQSKKIASRSRASAYKERRERARVIEEALASHCDRSTSHSDTSSACAEVSDCEGDQENDITATPDMPEEHPPCNPLLMKMRNFVKTIVGVVNYVPCTVADAMCQATVKMNSKESQTKRKHFRSVKTQCTIVGHSFANLPANSTLPESVTQCTTENDQSKTTSNESTSSSTEEKKKKRRVSHDETNGLCERLEFVASSTPKPKAKRRDNDVLVDASGIDDDSITHVDSEAKDPTWNPDMSYGEIVEDNESQPDDLVKLYVVSERKLLKLFNHCQKCGSRGADASVASVNGTLVTISQYCLRCDEVTRWNSQDMIGTYPSGNIGLSTALLCSGSIPSKAIRMLQFWGVQCYQKQTYFTHQRNFLNQAIYNCWEEEYIRVMCNFGDEVQLSGDARCDSMGHCAKYGSYTLHDTKQNAIVCTELVVSTEPATKKSAAMEVLGLERALDLLDGAVPHIKMSITTDGHTGVAKHLREQHADKVDHYLDIWHVAKGVKKRIAKVSKKFPVIAAWKRSIINHLYWSAVTSANNGALIVAKWSSLANHIVNIHHHNDELFPSCVHGNIGARRWFDPASEAYDTLCKRVILNRDVLKAVAKLSSDGQTSGLEGFHSTVNQFAPKMFHFGYQGMKSRLSLAALHFNENSNRGQRMTRDGKPAYSIKFPKNRGGQYIAVPEMKNRTYEYAEKVKKEVVRLVESGKTYVFEDDPPLLSSLCERPASKEVAIEQRKAHARFK